MTSDLSAFSRSSLIANHCLTVVVQLSTTERYDWIVEQMCVVSKLMIFQAAAGCDIDNRCDMGYEKQS